MFSGIFKAVDQVTNFDPPETEILYWTLKAQMFFQQRGGQMRSLVWAFVENCVLILTFVVVVAFTQSLSIILDCSLLSGRVSAIGA